MLHRSQFIRSLVLAAVLTLPSVGAAFAGNPSGTGQPNASCESSALKPPGFNSGGFANADLHYAGNGIHSLNAKSGNAVSQYDVACYQQTSNGH
jgi:hypothetical protein